VPATLDRSAHSNDGEDDPLNNFEAMNATGYGPILSSVWDEYFGEISDTDQAVDLLAKLADGRPILEYGVGVGRLALPLRDRQLVVHGVDNSPWMIEQLRKKPGGDTLPVTLGDFATVTVGGRFGLIVLAYSTLFALASQELQIKCFMNAKKHLDTGGLFVVEAMTLHDLLAEDGRCWTVNVDANRVILVARRANAVTQKIYECSVIIRDGEPPIVHPEASRYSSPGELDLMARIAGMRLCDRWGGWDRRPFTRHDRSHVSVYELIT
jgi:Methyltransferase domain